MTPERWQQIDEVFRAAIERPVEGRESFLDRTCDGDSELRREVEALLAADSEAGEFLEEAVEAEAEQLAESRAGTRIGAYEVVRKLGSGGMGSVYLAVRADQRYRKEVAIKVLKRGLDTDEVLRRFRLERQILAGLDHPNIARLLDAATSDDGLPCFVMEVVEGSPIDRYCADHDLSIPQRLGLFRTVCSAVQAAHRNLVVHRDLKPSNILVTADGTPKLLDFGVAKLLDPESVPQTVVATEHYRPMTPEFASPEQVRGEAITTASDVYSLGVLLYLLLSGRRPYRVDPRRVGEMERIICETEPGKPSVVAGRQLEGDLDIIILKALAKEPRQRYGSVDQLSEDLRRHLEGLPILARQPTFRYRAGKFFRRHRTGVAMAATSVALLIGGIVTTTWQAHVAKEERIRAEAELRRAEEVSDFMEDLFQVADRSQVGGETITAFDLLERGAEQLRSESWETPETQASLLDTIGRSFQGIGLYPQAIESFEAALGIRRQALGDEHLDVAETFDNLAHAHFALASLDSAEEHLRAALVMRQHLLGDDHPMVAESLNNLAQVMQRQRDLETAESLLRQALEIKKRNFGVDHPSVAIGMNNLAGLLNRKGDYAAAEALFRETLHLRRKLFGDRHASIAESLNNLGGVLYKQADWSGAAVYFRQGLELRRELHGDEHPWVARSLGNLGTVLLEQGDHAAAEPLLRQSLAMRQRFFGDEHPSLGFPLDSLGWIHETRDDLEEAERLYRHSLAIRRKTPAEGHLEIAASALALGALLLDLGALEEAEPLLRESLEIRKNEGPAWLIAEAESALGGLLLAEHRFPEAEALLQASHRVLEAQFGERNRRTVRARSRLLSLVEAQGQSYGSGQSALEQFTPARPQTSR